MFNFSDFYFTAIFLICFNYATIDAFDEKSSLKEDFSSIITGVFGSIFIVGFFFFDCYSLAINYFNTVEQLLSEENFFSDLLSDLSSDLDEDYFEEDSSFDAVEDSIFDADDDEGEEIFSLVSEVSEVSIKDASSVAVGLFISTVELNTTDNFFLVCLILAFESVFEL